MKANGAVSGKIGWLLKSLLAGICTDRDSAAWPGDDSV